MTEVIRLLLIRWQKPVKQKRISKIPTFLQAERILRLTRVVFMHMDLLWQVSQLHLETAGHCSDSEICRTSEKVLSCMQRPCISGNMSIPVMESKNFRLLQMRSWITGQKRMCAGTISHLYQEMYWIIKKWNKYRTAIRLQSHRSGLTWLDW